MYDNTLHPTYVPGRYCNIFKSRKIKIKDDVIQIPISVTPVFRLPFSWIWIRNLGVNYIKLCLSAVFLSQKFAIIYIHNWELAEIGKNSAFKLPNILQKNTGKKMAELLADIFKWCYRQHFVMQTIINFLRFKGYNA